jgi:hypothetical protein
LMGKLALVPMDMMRVAAAAKEVEAQRIAGLALERWLVIDPRARDLLSLLD